VLLYDLVELEIENNKFYHEGTETQRKNRAFNPKIKYKLRDLVSL